ncbi:hypothetical protein Pan97_24950 [Bremerella volcania]|uniref:Uncharacterized protein n=1 Tax=Bremerella volcania TaxID=2527984 RepID=A0A518C8B2_9BACT|nr:WD40 repeat domain-containing protein [Bremerella volcania]QDU75463.1 hypothetical protein Pan97_24950 [Bremerella volcania]
MKTLGLLSCMGLLIAISVAPVSLSAQDETTEEIIEIVDRLSQKVPAPKFEIVRMFRTPMRHKEYMDVSEDGSRMVFIQRDKKISTWNLDASMKIAEFMAAGQAIEGVLKISRDGRYVAFANQRKFVEVWEVETGELIQTFAEMDWKIGDLGFSLDSQLMYISGTRGQRMIVTPDGEVVDMRAEPLIDEERRIRVCNFGQDCWATVIERTDKDVNEVFWETPDGEGHADLPHRNPPNISGGPGVFCVFCGAEYWVGPYGSGHVSGFSTQQWLTDVRIDTIENPEVANYLWIATWSGAEVCGVWHPEHTNLITVPRPFDPYVMLLPAPNTQRIIEQSPGGRVVVHELDRKEFRASAYRTKTILDSVLFQKRFDVLQGVAKRWEHREDPIIDNKLTTAYSELVHYVANFRDTPRNNDEQIEYLKEMAQEHPDSDVFRLALASKYYSLGTEARGSGAAFQVAPEAWETLDKYMEKTWETIEPMLDQENVPPEVYVWVVMVARYQNWPDARLDPYLERAMKECPTYHRIWKQACMSKLPRWGGAPGDTEALAAKVADHIGGIEGDIVYAEVGRLIYIFFTWRGLVEEAGFDKDRMMRGMVGLCERSPDVYAENLALQFAREFKDHAAAHRIATLWKERNHTYIHRLWKWDKKEIDDTLAWALADELPQKEEEPAQQDHEADQ